MRARPGVNFGEMEGQRVTESPLKGVGLKRLCYIYFKMIKSSFNDHGAVALGSPRLPPTLMIVWT